MLSQLKSREIAPAPMEPSKQEPESGDTKHEKVGEGVDLGLQAAKMGVCDALCSLANSATTLHPTTIRTPAATHLATNSMSVSVPGSQLRMHGFLPPPAMVPAVLPAVQQPPQLIAPTTTISSGANTTTITASKITSSGTSNGKSSMKEKACPKQHQLPLFLSKTYHMIDRCDPDIATWSPTGDNFVVKNVEKFASAVLPMYFKHSNFSSFARQLNFYGFRKLRSDPILTNDIDPQTAAYVRFYHEKFQKGRPELLHSIKRATKSDQQSKDDVDDLKSQVLKLKQCVVDMSTQMERKLSEINEENTRRMSYLTAHYEKLAALVSHLLQQQQQQQQHQRFPKLPPQHLPAIHPPQPPSSSEQPQDAPTPPLPPIVETMNAVPTTSSTTTSVSTSGSGGLSTTHTLFTPNVSSESLSSNISTVPSHVGGSARVGQRQQQKMESLSQVVAMSLMATGDGGIPQQFVTPDRCAQGYTLPKNLALITQNLEYISEEMKKNEKTVTAASTQNSVASKHASNGMKNIGRRLAASLLNGDFDSVQRFLLADESKTISPRVEVDTTTTKRAASESIPSSEPPSSRSRII